MAEYKVPSPKELQELRRKSGLTQLELASRVGISQSLIARIERGQVNPSISTLKKILAVIEREKEVHSFVRDLMKWKSTTTKIPNLIWVNPEDKVRRAVILMKKHDISQLPVLKKNIPIGSIYEGTIFRQLMVMDSRQVFSLSVREIMDSPFPTIQLTESIQKALSKIASGVEALLVMDQERPVGIITKIDIITFMKL